MSEHDHGDGGSPLFSSDEDHAPPAGATAAGSRSSGRRRARRRSGCLPMLIVLALLVVGGIFLVRSIDVANPFSSEPDDFEGAGSGAVTFEVSAGDSISAMAQNLESLDVVASAEAFVDAAEDDDRSGSIQQGLYRLRKEMSAASALDLIVGGTTRGEQFTFVPGKTVEEIVDLLARDTDIARADFEKALDDPASIGLPASAEDDAEGYLFPGSYLVFQDSTATSILSEMVAGQQRAAEEVDLPAAAERLGYSEHDLMTIASLIQAEGSLLDEKGKSKIARVIYNRLENPGGETAGRLELDATIDFIYGDKVARRTNAEIEAVADNPYNTYEQPGLPPGPIATPSLDALRAAVGPADGPWFFYVTVNLESGLTKFAVTYADFLQLRAELDEYCDTQSDRC
ncbi:endolytic transglycosylase MltG [Nocardioides sp. 1609]|uniref:endolytic transglycosylase MltG n=1 Tax=Nocardioides sp. 1609 TaxID=2508327 RepID=UPI00106F4DB1|nr:endolytic transglycosylase MltG [Nocardioides sp. 1609]